MMDLKSKHTIGLMKVQVIKSKVLNHERTKTEALYQIKFTLPTSWNEPNHIYCF